MTSIPMSPDQRYQAAKLAKTMLQNQLLAKDATGALGKGILAGGGIGGALVLGQMVRNSVAQPSSSYTAPVETTVYRPDREKKKRTRKRADGPPVPPIDAGPSAASLRESSWFSNPAVAGAVVAGVPLGIIGARKLTNRLREVARDRELRAAQRQFEESLQDYAEAGDEPIQVMKRSSFPDDRSYLASRLAANCSQLSELVNRKEAIFPEMGKAALTWAVLSSLVAGGAGFSQGWKQRAAGDLRLAERQLNMAREQANPTFTVATLANAPDRDKAPDDTDPIEHRKYQQQVQQSIDRGVNNLDISYL